MVPFRQDAQRRRRQRGESPRSNTPSRATDLSCGREKRGSNQSQTRNMNICYCPSTVFTRKLLAVYSEMDRLNTDKAMVRSNNMHTCLHHTHTHTQTCTHTDTHTCNKHTDHTHGYITVTHTQTYTHNTHMQHTNTH